MPIKREKILRVVGRRFVAGVIFERNQSGWHIKETAPILKWLKNIPLAEIPTRLAKQGCSWTWI